jgi:hypothetical protein
MTIGYALLPRKFFNETVTRSMTDAEFRAAIYIIAGPHSNSIGAMDLPPGYLSSDLGINQKKAEAIYRALVAHGVIQQFGDQRHIFLTRHFEWNTIQNPNVFKSAMKLLQALPSDPLVSQVINGMKPFAKRFGVPFENALEAVWIEKCQPFSITSSTTLSLPILKTITCATAPPLAGQELDIDEFTTFWETYPGKGNKILARQQFEFVIASGLTTASEVIAAAARFVDKSKLTNSTEPLLPANSWLKCGGWRDA